jgi:hypothetical protein
MKGLNQPYVDLSARSLRQAFLQMPGNIATLRLRLRNVGEKLLLSGVKSSFATKDPVVEKRRYFFCNRSILGWNLGY